MRIVRGELRVDAVGHRQQLARIGDVGDVGVGLAREHGIAGKAERLRPLDLGVPIGALDQAHHDLPVEPPRQRVEPVDDEGGARPIGLHDDAETVPAGKLGLGKHALDDVERQIEPVGLLGVDVEPHAGMAGGERQRQQPLAHHRQHRLLLRHLVARMDRRKLDRDAGIAADVGAGGAAVQRRDRVGIGMVVADRIGLGARRLAEHVVGIEIALRRSSGGRAAPLPRWCGRARTARPFRASPPRPQCGSPARRAGAPWRAACLRCRPRPRRAPCR